MRSSIYQRRARANNLRISVRDDAQVPVEDPDLSDSEDEGEPDSPSPTSPDFPDGTPDATSTSISSSSTEPASTATNLPAIQTDSIIAGASQDGISSSNDDLQAQVSDGGNDMPGMSKGAIAFGTIGGVVIVTALVLLVWKFGRRRRRGRTTSGGLFSRFTTPKFKRMEEPQQRGTVDYGPPERTQSRIMDDLMAAAYAAEDGSASQYGAFAEEKQQLNAPAHPPQTRQPDAPDPRASNSLYVNQLMSGFYKGARADGLAVPADARMPPPVAPSVAGQTEATNTTESTWKTWGWSQQKKPKETWVDKCIRRGGLR